MNESNSTMNAILVILIVIVVGFIVWFVMSRPAGAPADNTSPAIQVNLPGSTGGDSTGAPAY
ncbi:MAG TPA: hypothetical protein VHD69_00440 [Candidatus Paceibacterota bacterium]|nr:hypothetical protein [Candidatus Paceibacterota bacterium]